MEPLDQSQIAAYIRKRLSDHHVEEDKIVIFCDKVANNLLFVGRARFTAFVIDEYLRCKDMDLAIQRFTLALGDLENPMFPFRFIKEDLENGIASFQKRIFSGMSLEQLIIDGLVQFLMYGEADLHVKSTEASAMIHYGLGFAEIRNKGIVTVKISGLAVIESLRCFFFPLTTGSGHK